MTVEKIKAFGEYVGFDSDNKCWLYAVGQQYYIINRNGSFEI